jgi:drug/metabolite transporter (DMT)-like permease
MTADAAGALRVRLDPRLVAVCWVVVAALAWTLVGVAVRYLGGRLPATDLSFYRSISGVLIMLPVIWPRRRTIAVAGFARRTMALYALRGMLIFGGQASFYFALAYIPLADATVLNASTPIFVAILAMIFLTERVGPLSWAMIVLGFVGIVVILRPGMTVIHLAAVFALISAVLFASGSITNKVLSRTEPASRIVFFTNVLILACGALPYAIFARAPSWDDVPLVLAVCVFGTVAQYCIARAFALADASFIGPMDFLRVPLAALAGWLLFTEFPDLWVWVGSAIVFTSVIVLTRSHVRVRPAELAS